MFNFLIQTNASLISDDIIAVLKQNMDLLSEPIIGVSIDGPREIDDKARILANGQPAFDFVMEGIRRIADSGIAFAAVCVVGSHNVALANEVYNFFKELKPVFCKFNACHNIDEKGNLEKLGISPVEYSKFLCKIFDLWMEDLLSGGYKSPCPICYPIQTIVKKCVSKISGITLGAEKQQRLIVSFTYILMENCGSVIRLTKKSCVLSDILAISFPCQNHLLKMLLRHH